MTSRCPLAEIRIQQFNFIDIIYELVLLGVLRGARPPIFPRPRGFLSHLMAMLYSISTATEHRMPTAEECMFHVQCTMAEQPWQASSRSVCEEERGREGGQERVPFKMPSTKKRLPGGPLSQATVSVQHEDTACASSRLTDRPAD
ncbi:hypothetical protein SRHO_G00320410 [Serrasalmus rhombeus]